MKRAFLVMVLASLVGTAQAGPAKSVKGATLYPLESSYHNAPIQPVDMPAIAILVKLKGQEIDRVTTWSIGRQAYWQRVADRERITLTIHRGNVILETIRPK